MNESNKSDLIERRKYYVKNQHETQKRQKNF